MTRALPCSPVTLWPHPGITPIEAWDVQVDGETLFDRRATPTFFEALARAALALRSGEATRANGDRLADVAFEVVALVGGAVDVARARAAFGAAGLALDVVSADPFFPAASAARALHAAAEGIAVIDVGQTAIKAVGAAGRTHRPRPDATPLASEIAAAVDAVGGERGPALALLALPCEVERDGRSDAIVLGPSTYCLPAIAGVLAAEVAAQLPRARDALAFAIVNDAVLAAWALARVSPRPGGARLVLTLGFGVGAAFEARA